MGSGFGFYDSTLGKGLEYLGSGYGKSYLHWRLAGLGIIININLGKVWSPLGVSTEFTKSSEIFIWL
ncbi:unnamed protein product [Anisakis simplex]|uniref:DUF3308 domain-containing protein n=1 Tax=Anisakis simplex TaxID=6269 RepID=A0A0M3K024_ANISI|nr:unnamed protein product [Anisakis simplex]